MNRRILLSAAAGLAGLGLVAVANASPASPLTSNKTLTNQSAVENVRYRCHWVRRCWVGPWGHTHCRWVRRCHHW